MKEFDVSIATYNFVEINICDLLMNDRKFEKEKKETKIKWLNEIFKTSNKKMNDFGGCYIFQITEDYALTHDFFDSLTLYVNKNETFEKIDFSIASSKSNDFPPDSNLRKNYLLYIGKAEANIFGRICEHLTNDKYNGNKSLKLGFPTRKEIVGKLKCFVALKEKSISCRKIEEETRRDFGSYFGEK